MKRIRIGVVGLGHRGRLMGQLAEEGFEFVDVVAACDLDPALFEETQWLMKKPMREVLPKASFFTDYNEMLETVPMDFVMVETGADVHCNFCVQALNKNINVFSDIPSVASLEEADRLWKAQQASKAKLMTGANPNEWGFINAMVDLYEKGLLGKPYYLEAEYVHSSTPADRIRLTQHSPWRLTIPPIRYCTHSLGPLLRIIEEDLRYVVCFGTGCHMENDGKRNSMEVALFQTESGVTIRLLRNGRCKAFIGAHSYRVFGTEGYFERIDTRGKTPAVVRFRSDNLYGSMKEFTELPVNEMPHEYAGNPKAEGHGGADYALLDHMFQAFLNGAEDFPISLRDGLRMTLPGIYAAESATRKGEKIRMTYPWDPDWEISG